MGKPRVTAELTVDTPAHAQTILNAIAQQLSGRDIFRQDSLEIATGPTGQVMVIFDCRLNLLAHRDAVRDWLRDQAENHPQVKLWILAVRLHWHDCGEDEPEPTHLEPHHPEYQAWRASRSCRERSFTLWERERA